MTEARRWTKRKLAFHSTLPRGERLIPCSCSFLPVQISIHAPARGATNSFFFSFCKNRMFQSTFPRGERPLLLSASKTCLYFNPHSREGSDVIMRFFDCHSFISIHAPTRGATAILHKKFVYFYTIPTINI